MQDEQQWAREQREQQQQGGSLQTLPRQAIAWNQVRSPGVYIEEDTGRLYRFLPEAIQQHGPVIHQTSRQQSRLQQLSTDPFLPQQEARRRAEEAGINNVAF